MLLIPDTAIDVLPQYFWVVCAALFTATVLLSRLIFFKPSSKNEAPWPRVPGALPIIGNSLGGAGIENFAFRIEEWAKLYGKERGVYECNIFGKRCIVLCSNDTVSAVAKERPFKMQRMRQLVASINSVGGYGLFSAEGDTWKADRRLVAPALNKKNIQDYLPFVKRVTKRLIEKWTSLSAQGGAVVINKDLVKYAIDNIAFIAFEEDFDSLRSEHSQETNDILMLFKALQFRTLSPFWFWKIPIIGQYLDGAGWSARRINKLFVDLVNDYEENCDKENSKKNRDKSFLARVISLSKRENTTMSQERMIGNLITMFAAGSETTHVTICSCLWEIATDCTGLQEELAAEAQALDNFCDASIDDITKKLPRLRSLVYEVIRLKGPAVLLGLQNMDSFTLHGTVLPPETNFIMALRYVSTLDSSGVRPGPSGERPSEFCSRRWLATDSSQKVPTDKVSVLKPSASMGGCMAFSTGFGSGLRLCPGKDLAEIEVLVCVASLLRNFEISLEEGHPPMKLVTRFTQSPDIDIRLMLKPRTPA